MIIYITAENLSYGDLGTLNKDNVVVKGTSENAVAIAAEDIPCGSMVHIDRNGYIRRYRLPS